KEWLKKKKHRVDGATVAREIRKTGFLQNVRNVPGPTDNIPNSNTNVKKGAIDEVKPSSPGRMIDVSKSLSGLRADKLPRFEDGSSSNIPNSTTNVKKGLSMGKFAGQTIRILIGGRRPISGNEMLKAGPRNTGAGNLAMDFNAPAESPDRTDLSSSMTDRDHAAKNPHRYSSDEYAQRMSDNPGEKAGHYVEHARAVAHAMAMGQHVPEHVKSEYPDFHGIEQHAHEITPGVPSKYNQGLSKVLQKMGNSKSGSRLKESLHTIEQGIHKHRHEHAVVVGPDGKELFRTTDGAADRASFTPKHLHMIAKTPGAVLTHNHPMGWSERAIGGHRGHSLSQTDVHLAAAAGLGEIRAVSPTHTYSMKPGPEGWSADHYAKNIGPVIRHEDRYLRDEFEDRIHEEQMSVHEAETKHHHELWQRVAKKTGLQYSAVEHKFPGSHEMMHTDVEKSLGNSHMDDKGNFVVDREFRGPKYGQRRTVLIRHVRHLHRAALVVKSDPTEAQKKAGNYQKAHVDLHGLRITIETPKGAVRSGTDRNGEAWSIKLKHPYGYIKGTIGKDKDHVDVILGDNLDSPNIWVINQNNASGGFDEHKVVLGATTEQEAKRTYLENYSPGWDRIGSMTLIGYPEFKKWLETGDQSKPLNKAIGKTCIPRKERSGEESPAD
ncbi:MAG: hypothetical protein ABJA67_07740, partial [Chthonomonadales bacterium]